MDLFLLETRSSKVEEILNTFPEMINYQDTVQGTAIHCACRNLCFPLMELFIAKAQVDLNIRDFDGETPLEILLLQFLFKLESKIGEGVDHALDETTKKP